MSDLNALEEEAFGDGAGWKITLGLVALMTKPNKKRHFSLVALQTFT